MSPSVENVHLPADRWELSGLLATPESSPRGTIVALHGGGMSARYFHGTTTQELSLLTLGAQAGWNVLALDRPGYGASVALPAERGRLVSQAELTFAALENFGAVSDVGAGYFLVGHSYGFKLGLHLGAHSRGGELLGIDGSGAGRRYRPERVNNVDVSGPPMSRDEALLHFWGPPELYPPGTFDAARAVISRSTGRGEPRSADVARLLRSHSFRGASASPHHLRRPRDLVDLRRGRAVGDGKRLRRSALRGDRAAASRRPQHQPRLGRALVPPGRPGVRGKVLATQTTRSGLRGQR